MTEPSSEPSLPQKARARFDSPAVKAILIRELTAGSTISAAARAAGMHRKTVHEHLRYDEQFVEDLDAAKDALFAQVVTEAVAQSRDRMRSLAPLAVEAIADALESKDKLRAAELLMKYVAEFQLAQQIEVSGNLAERLKAMDDLGHD